MQAGDLENAVKAELADGSIGLGKEKVEIEEFAHRLQMNQQRRVDHFRIGLGEHLQLMCEFGQQFIRRLCCGYGIADLLFDVHGLGKRAQVEADDGTLQPALGGDDDFANFG